MLEVLGSIPVRTISVISDIRGANSKRQGETGRAISILQTEDTGRLQYRRWKSLLARGYSGRVLQTIQYRYEDGETRAKTIESRYLQSGAERLIW
jgi:hypothetical protein